MKLGDRIKTARETARPKMSQTALAEACGWRYGSRVGNYEQGTNEPKLDDLHAIAKATEVNLAWLLSESGEMRPRASVSAHDGIEDEVRLMILRELTRALVANTPDVARDFSVLLREQAAHRGFATNAGLLDAVLATVEQGQHVAAAAVRRASHALSRGQPTTKKPGRSRP